METLAMKYIVYTIFILALCVSILSSAQDKPISSGFIEASFGFTLPVDGKGSLDYRGETPGIAGVPLHFAWPFFKYVGISSKLMYGTSKVNEDDIIADAQNYRSDLKWRLESGNYAFASQLFGLYLTYPFKSVDLDFELFFGRASFGIPKMTVHGYGPNTELYTLIVRSGTVAFSSVVMPSLGTRVKLSERVSGTFRTEYQSIIPYGYTENYIDTRERVVSPYILWAPYFDTWSSSRRFNRLSFQMGISLRFPHPGKNI